MRSLEQGPCVLHFRRWRIAAALGVICLITSCASVGQYFSARGADAVDILRVQGLAGMGFDLKLEATHFVELGLGFFHGYAGGLGSRHVGCWEVEIVDIGLPAVYSYKSAATFANATEPSAVHDYQLGNVFRSDKPVYVVDPPRFLEWLSVRGSACLFVGVNLEVHLGEAIDFLCGIAGFDPANDDQVASNSSPAPPA